jgi:hypothetical protein
LIGAVYATLMALQKIRATMRGMSTGGNVLGGRFSEEEVRRVQQKQYSEAAAAQSSDEQAAFSMRVRELERQELLDEERDRLHSIEQWEQDRLREQQRECESRAFPGLAYVRAQQQQNLGANLRGEDVAFDNLDREVASYRKLTSLSERTKSLESMECLFSRMEIAHVLVAHGDEVNERVRRNQLILERYGRILTECRFGLEHEIREENKRLEEEAAFAEFAARVKAKDVEKKDKEKEAPERGRRPERAYGALTGGPRSPLLGEAFLRSPASVEGGVDARAIYAWAHSHAQSQVNWCSRYAGWVHDLRLGPRYPDTETLVRGEVTAHTALEIRVSEAVANEVAALWRGQRVSLHGDELETLATTNHGVDPHLNLTLARRLSEGNETSRSVMNLHVYIIPRT